MSRVLHGPAVALIPFLCSLVSGVLLVVAAVS